MAPLGIFDLGGESRTLTDAPFGTNMAFRRRIFEKCGFRTDLGPGPNNEMRSEDTEFGSRLIIAGERIKYAPDAIVYHPVPQARLHKEFFLTWWYNKGRADIRENGIAADTKWFVCGIPLYLFRRLAVGTLRWMVTLEPSRRFSRSCGCGLLPGGFWNPTRQSKEVRHEGKKLTSV